MRKLFRIGSVLGFVLGSLFGFFINVLSVVSYVQGQSNHTEIIMGQEKIMSELKNDSLAENKFNYLVKKYDALASEYEWLYEENEKNKSQQIENNFVNIASWVDTLWVVGKISDLSYEKFENTFKFDSQEETVEILPDRSDTNQDRVPDNNFRFRKSKK